jgi:hypothetical protein
LRECLGKIKREREKERKREREKERKREREKERKTPSLLALAHKSQKSLRQGKRARSDKKKKRGLGS